MPPSTLSQHNELHRITLAHARTAETHTAHGGAEREAMLQAHDTMRYDRARQVGR